MKNKQVSVCAHAHIDAFRMGEVIGGLLHCLYTITMVVLVFSPSFVFQGQVP